MRTLVKIIAYAALLACCAAASVHVGVCYREYKERAAAERYDVSRITYTVQPGDTLWQIAGRYAHLDERAECFEEFMYWARTDNNGAELHPGDVVTIRYYTEKK